MSSLQLTRLESAYLRGRARSRFRGGALETCARTPLGKGHNNDDRPFDVATAHYTRPVFAEYDQAIRNGWKRKIVVLAGVKTLKSLDLEICALDHGAHRRGDTAIYFGTETAAEATATTRIWDYFKANEYFAKKMETLKDRHQDTMGALKFPDKTVFVLAANLGNTQQKNLGFAGLQDAFVTGKSGMIKEMIARTTQYQDRIVFIESQGGEKGDDFDAEWNETNQGECYVKCPACGHDHVFNWKAWDERHMTRPEDFKPIPPRLIPSLDHEAWIAHHQPLLKGCCAGFQRTDPHQLTLPADDEKFTEAEVMANTHFECFHCGGKWLDTSATRTALDESSFYIPARPDALPENVGFNWAQWINTKLPWNTMMLQRLNANRDASEYGNYKPISQWWQKVAARVWDPDLMNRSRLLAVNVSTYAPEPGVHAYGDQWHCRQMTVDTGKAPDAGPDEHRIGRLFFEIRDISNTGSSRQVARGILESTADDHDRHWKLLRAQQIYWGIPNNRVAIDAAYMPSQVEDAAVRFFELVKFQNTPMHLPSTWRLMLGAGTNRISLHNKGISHVDSQIPGTRKSHDPKGKLWRLVLQKTTWSNYWFEQQFESIIMKTTGVQWEILERNKIVVIEPHMAADGTETFVPSEELTRKAIEYEAGGTDKWHPSWEDQLNSRYMSSEKKEFLDYDKPSRPTEGRDTSLMHIVLMARDGLLGHTQETK